MVESRCGLICSNLECKKQFKCTCCVNMKNPAWGNCEVKDCCESKNLNHCGECKFFPCELLKRFSYDLEHGDSGSRIETCKLWRDINERENMCVK